VRFDRHDHGIETVIDSIEVSMCLTERRCRIEQDGQNLYLFEKGLMVDGSDVISRNATIDRRDLRAHLPLRRLTVATLDSVVIVVRVSVT
jgi:hypothetical protein